MTEITINIDMDEEDFANLYSNTQDWGVGWSIPGRFLESDRTTGATPSWTWAKAYWVGSRRADMLLMRGFIRGYRQNCDVIWDTQAGVETSPGVFEGSYVVLTDYGSYAALAN